jgi:hypothetical protein
LVIQATVSGWIGCTRKRRAAVAPDMSPSPIVRASQSTSTPLTAWTSTDVRWKPEAFRHQRSWSSQYVSCESGRYTWCIGIQVGSKNASSGPV